MKIATSPDGYLRLESNILTLGKIVPTVNLDPLRDCTLISQENYQWVYASPKLEGGKFVIEAKQDGNYVWLHYWLENLSEDFWFDAIGIEIIDLENVGSFLQNGYFSWDGSRYIEIERAEKKSWTGYAMTQILPRFGGGSVVIGFESHHRFQQYFSWEERIRTLDIATMWEKKSREGLTRCEAERLVIFEHSGVEDALREWAQIVADAAPVPPRLSAPQITGWCSWYNLYAYITEENILDHLRGAEKVKDEGLPLRVFQIDDGFTPEMGDWLDVKPQFPRGMKPLLDDIRAAGFIPGLWIAPFMVGNRSQLYRDHPDWVVREHSGKPLIQMNFYGEFRWHKRSEEYYILDTTHPAAFDYLRQVFRVWRHEWGCEYFKTDFMHFGSEHGANRAIFHQEGMTRIEIWRRVAEMIREEIGEALWLGCGCPLYASIGLVDGVRIGKDVGVDWDAGTQSAQSLLRDMATRNYANKILWQADPDCILLRHQFHNLSDQELEALAIYAGMSGGVVMTSDQLGELSLERLNLFRLLLSDNPQGCSFPLLGQSDPVLVQVRGTADQYAIFVFNPTDQTLQRSYPLAVLGLPENLYAHEWRGVAGELIQHLRVSLAPHAGRLFFLAPKPLTTIPDRLP